MANSANDADKSKIAGDVNRILSGRHEHRRRRFPNGRLPLSRFAILPEASVNLSASSSLSTSMQQNPLPNPEKDCVFFVNTGYCSFNGSCRFNHPTPEKAQLENKGSNGNGNATGSDPEKLKPTITCKFFSAGVCYNGALCRFNHINEEVQGEYQPPDTINSLGLPIRLGVQACSYYLRHGTCGYGLNCKYNHPVAPNDHHVYVLFEDDQDSLNYQNASFEVTDGGYYTQIPDLNQPYYPQAPMVNINYQGLQPTFGQQQVPGKAPPVNSPDSPCVETKPVVLNDVGLPLRPGKKVCWHWEKSGDCRYAHACVFDHPPKLSSNDDETSSSMSAPDAKTPEIEE